MVFHFNRPILDGCIEINFSDPLFEVGPVWCLIMTVVCSLRIYLVLT